MSQSSSSSNASVLHKVLSPSFLSTNKKPELLRNLIELHNVLQTITQDPSERPMGLQLIANQIVNPRLINHSDKDVRLLSACCAVDILRIYAPEAPYNDEELLRVFKVIIVQIRGLSGCNVVESGTGAKMFYIVTSLSTVKSCVVLVSLAKSGIPGSAELLVEFFDAVINAVHAEHPGVVGAHLSSILQACIEEMDVVEQDVLEMLLQPLTPSNKTDNPAAYSLCQSVLRRSAPFLEAPISNLVNQYIIALSEKSSAADRNDGVYAMVYEIHKISSNLLLRILPNLCILLQVEDEDTRLKAVKLLGRLFLSPHAEYGAQFSRNFRDYLARLNDISPTIRHEVIVSAANVLQKKPALRPTIEELIVKKLRDADNDVRTVALSSLLEVATENPLNLAPSTFIELAERMRDKKIEIRRSSLAGLAKVYSKHLCPLFPALAADFDMRRHAAVVDRLKCVPSYVIGSWGYTDLKTRLHVIEVLQEFLLPMHRDEEGLDDDSREVFERRRAAALLFLYRALSSAEQSMLGVILTWKARTRDGLQRLLQTRASKSSSAAAAAAAAAGDSSEEVKAALYSLMSTLVPADKKTLIHDKVIAIKDKHVFRLLAYATEPARSIYELTQARDDVCARVDSKSALGEYLRGAFEVSCAGLANSGLVGALLDYMASLAQDDSREDEDIGGAVGLLTAVAKSYPIAFQGTTWKLESWIASCADAGDASIAAACSAVVKHISPAISRASPDALPGLCDICLKCCAKSTDMRTIEVLAEAAAALGENGAENSVLTSIKSLMHSKRLSESNKRIECDITQLFVLLRDGPKVVARRLNAGDLSHLVTLLRGLCISSNAKVLCAAMKAWASVCRQMAVEDEAGDEEKEEDIPAFIPIEVEAFLTALLSTVADGGASFMDAAIDDEDRPMVREAAALSAFILFREKSTVKSLTPEQWHTIAWSLLDPVPAIRRNIMLSLNALIQSQPVHPKVLALPCLLATDDALSAAAESALMVAVRRLRKTHQSICEVAMYSQNEGMQKLAENNLPETMLPYALHLLSHHPDFPSSATIDSEQDKRRMKAVMKSLSMVVNVLLDTVYTAGDNLSYLFKQVNIITQFYTDRIDPGNLGLSFVTRLTRKMLNEKIRAAENLQSYPGDISLPMDLFSLCDENENEDGLETEQAIDQALSKVGQAKTKKRRQAEKPSTPIGKKASRQAHTKKSSVTSKNIKSAKLPKASFSDDEEADDASIEQVLTEPTTTRPLRSGRLAKAVRYKEVDEDDREVEKWDQLAAVKPTKAKEHGVKRKADEENVFDFDERPAKVSASKRESSGSKAGSTSATKALKERRHQ